MVVWWTSGAAGCVCGSDVCVVVWLVVLLVQLASDDDCNGVLTSCVTVSVTAGASYAIQVDGYNGAWGPVTLRVSEAAPANDNYAK